MCVTLMSKGLHIYISFPSNLFGPACFQGLVQKWIWTVSSFSTNHIIFLTMDQGSSSSKAEAHVTDHLRVSLPNLEKDNVVQIFPM